jgi:hypothetical protein
VLVDALRYLLFELSNVVVVVVAAGQVLSVLSPWRRIASELAMFFAFDDLRNFK